MIQPATTTSLLLSLSLLLTITIHTVSSSCGFPGAPAHSSVRFVGEVTERRQGAEDRLEGEAVSEGTIAEYSCDRGFELLGPARRVCGGNGTWSPQGIPFCVLNVAAGKAPMQSSVSEGGIPQKAVDGSTSTFFDQSTCSLTEVEKSPWWYVNLLEPYMVQLVRIDFGQSCCAKGRKATIVVRVGNNRPDLGVNPICNRFTGLIEEGRPLFLPCNPPMPGAFVSVHFESPPGVSLSICEAFVYTDQALPIERCPTFRDQKPGSTATYNGKCYIFYGQQPRDFEGALDFCRERGGSLVDESNPALQGFLSWELWRRHRGDPNGQYWLGAQRDSLDLKNWKWISGKTVTVSFWNLPGGDDDCARFDGTKGWLWSDTSCKLKLNYICQHRPTTCGKPEQPPNSTLVSEKFSVGSRIEYICDEGHLLVGPAKRNCLATGFYSEFPPVCRYLECGMPADIANGRLEFVNGTRQFKSIIKYACGAGHVLVGRNQLMCDVDQRWNGPPPRCEPIYCEEPKQIRYGGFSLSTNSTRFSTVVTYYCTSSRHELVGPKKITCLKDGSYNSAPPSCREIRAKEKMGVAPTVIRPPKRKYSESKRPIPTQATEGTEESLVRVKPNGDRVRLSDERVRPKDERVRPSDESVRPNNERVRLNDERVRPSGERVRPNGDRVRANGDRVRPNGERVRRPFGDRARPGVFPVRKPSSTPRSVRTRQPEQPEFRPPIENEIPDSANVQKSPAGADVPDAVENEREARQAQLNLGGIIALGVFGGFVFLAAIITTIVILIRRKDGGSLVDDPSFRSSIGSEVDREASEVVVNSHHRGHNKEKHGHGHRHHHHHKHRRGDREDRHHRY